MCKADLIAHLSFGQNLALVVERVERALHLRTHYPANKCYQNQLIYRVDSDFSNG